MASTILSKILLIINGQTIDTYNSLTTLLSEDGWQVKKVSWEAIREYCTEDEKRVVCIAILNFVEDKLSPTELVNLKEFCANGNSLLVAASATNNQLTTKLNKIVSMYGIKFNQDCVIRPNLYKHYHPTEAILEDFIVNRGLNDSMKKHIKRSDDVMVNPVKELLAAQKMVGNVAARILYANGCTLRVTENKLSTIMMTSSPWALPVKQAICAFCKVASSRCRVVAIGSAAMMNDNYLNKEDNRALIKSLFEFIADKEFPVNLSDAKTVEIPDFVATPDTNHLLNIPIACLQESEPLPDDKSSLIDRKLFNIDNSMIPTIAQAFKDLDVAHEPLTLIKPNFSCKSLKLSQATHGFLLRRSLSKIE